MKVRLKLCKTSNNIHKIDISSQSVPQRRAPNHEKYPTIQNWYLITIHPAKASSQSCKISNNTKLISYHNSSREGELSIIKNIQQSKNWYLII